MNTQNIWNKLEKYGFGADIEALENYINRLQNSAAMGEPEVTDAEYDDLVGLLRMLKPESAVINRNWEVDDTEITNDDKYLEIYGMKSIKTIQSLDDIGYFAEMLSDSGTDLFASIKLNGHAFRCVYINGEIKSATTRGRYKRGRDITKQIIELLPVHIDDWEDVSIVEIRGELLVSLEKFKELSGILKTPLSAVTSLSKESATSDEIKNLSACCYQIYSDNGSFDTLFDKFDYLEQHGFETPYAVRSRNVNKNSFSQYISYIINYFEKAKEDGKIKYDSDGIVVAIDNISSFYKVGVDGNTQKGNMALKLGKYWESNVYKSTIIDIEWCYGKSHITPKAVIEETIMRNGASVTKVPLYNIGVMQRYQLYPNNEIYFKFGGETGVSACDQFGNSVSA